MISKIYLNKRNRSYYKRGLIKIKRKYIILFLLILIVIVASACKKEKVECTTSADCLHKTCSVSKCDQNKCSYSLQRNCCGNGLQDEIENGKPGNKCTCPQDYGKCEGKGKVKAAGRLQNTTYLYYYCNEENECIFAVKDEDIEIQNFPDTISIGFFKASMLVTYNKPTSIIKDTFKFKISLDDLSKELVPPIQLIKLKLYYSSELSRTEQLIAEKELDSKLTNIGDEVLIETPLNLGYKPREAEETGVFRYGIDYTYIKRVMAGKDINGSIIYTNEPIRTTFNSLGKPVFFVRGVI